MTDKVLKHLKETKTMIINGIEPFNKSPKKVSTGNYCLSFNESKNKNPIKFAGWILVKNRE